MTRLIWCANPLVLVLLVHIYTAQGSVFTQLKDGESPAGCSLRADMLMEHCLSPAEVKAVRNEKVNLQDLFDSRKDAAHSDSQDRRRQSGQIIVPSPYNHVGDLKTSLLKSEDGEEAETRPWVVNGAACLVSSTSRGTSMYLCQQGSWMAFKKLSDRTVVSNVVAKSRVKRQSTSWYNYVDIQVTNSRRKCHRSWIFFKKCKTVYYTETIRNAVPKITCYNIPDFVAEPGKDKAHVEWPAATANDKEDGTLRVRQTEGPTRYSYVNEGTYTVTYEAKDSRGTTAYCSETFKVKVIRCPRVYSINDYTQLDWYYLENGQVNCTADVKYGSICTFSCNSGYELNRGGSLKCLRDGKWDNLRPSCVQSKCSSPPTVSNGNYGMCGNQEVGSTCTLVCNYGYAVVGQSRITCLSNRTYSSPGRCSDITPPQITCPASQFVNSRPKGQPTPVSWSEPSVSDNSGQRVTVSSNFRSGSFFPVGRTEVTFTATDTSSNTASCAMTITVHLKRCSSLFAPVHGQLECNYNATIGSECTFTCLEGFDLQGDSSRTCLDTEQWSGTQPSCERKLCGMPDGVRVNHGSFSCPNIDFNYQDTCTLLCETGYTAQPPLTITCNSSLQWTSAGSCKDTESPQFLTRCLNIVEYASGPGQDTYVTFTLPQARDNSGGPVDVVSSPPSGTLFQLGKTNVTVVARDESGNEESCMFTVEIQEIMCPDPLNANLDDTEDELMQFSCPNGYVLGATCEVSCSDNNPVGGQSIITCARNGTSKGYWHYGNLKPFCEEEICPTLETPEHGALVCDTLGDREICTIQCQENYTYPGDGDGVAYCHPQSGHWFPGDISSINTCVAGLPAENVEIMPEIYYYSNSCSQDNREIASNFFKIINASTLFSDVCTSNNVTCRAENVKITCGSRSKRSVGNFANRSTDDAVYIIKVVFVVIIPYKRQGSARDTKRFYEGLANMLNDGCAQGVLEGKYDMPDVGQTDDKSYHFGVPGYTCSHLKVHQDASGMCVGCGKGYIYVNTSQSCSICPKGSYQPQVEAEKCLQCQDMYTTKYDGAISENNCLPACAPGSYSKYGTTPCDTCPRGSYQDNSGQTECHTCPYGMSTVAEGATSRDACEFYEIRLDDSTVGPEISDYEDTDDFTLWTWVNIPSDLLDTRTTFSFTQREGAALLGFGEFQIYILVNANVDRLNRKEWYHISAVKTGSLLELIINGEYTENRSLSSPLYSGYSPKISFTPGNNLPVLTISEMQFGKVSIGGHYFSKRSPVCGSYLPGNILTGEENDNMLTTLSRCDDHDGCTESPCGSHGICIDTEQSFRCLCNGFWSGDRCQLPPDFCTIDLCSNGASCVSASDGNRFECQCSDDYRGTFCEEKIVHGGWNEWASWSACSKTCGGGMRSRERTCDNPPPDADGRPCEGESQQTSNCSVIACPVDGGFSAWTDWECSVTCGNGTSRRTRTCSNPAPTHGGKNCNGPLEEEMTCNRNPCPVDGGLSDWSEWSECSKSCGGGESYRTRECNNPAPQNGGADCSDENRNETKSCNVQSCPSCSPLKDFGSNTESIECSHNETTDMLLCYVKCKKGYTCDDNNGFTCGRLSNYTWSHVTKDNPRGLLPPCTKAVTPQSLTLKFEFTFDGVLYDMNNIKNIVKKNVQKFISCPICVVNVTTTVNDNRRKRSTGSTKTMLSITMPSPNADMDLENMSDEEIEAQLNALYELEDAAAAVVNNSEEIFKVELDGQTVIANTELLTVGVDSHCSVGTQLMDGLCVDCGLGTYWVNKTCELCPEGYYQDTPKMSSCEECPSGTSTAGKGAQSIEHCVKDPSMYLPLELGYWDDPNNETEHNGNGGGNKASGQNISPRDMSTLVIITISFLFCYYSGPLTE